MPVLSNSKHELFAQAIAKGGNLVDSFISVGYAKASAHSNATRLMGNDGILKRIEELKTAVAVLVVHSEASDRSWRIAVLQDRIKRKLALSDARALEYADHPGGATGLLVKDYRGKNAEQEIWKADCPLESSIRDDLKQIAIEEGQWMENPAPPAVNVDNSITVVFVK